ncbi:hypothetical protein [Yinghuangia sp. YIM S10712]|uniref:hypothetical protein n=1 Tax=Yinghuangia sp. YIM S10712 TaxID=3436930 RepID=UPI003F53A812
MDANTPDMPEIPAEPPPGFPTDLTVACQACDGDGWRYAPQAALIGHRIVAIGKQEACLACGTLGRHPWRSGPGVKVKSHERTPLPGYF